MFHFFEKLNILNSPGKKSNIFIAPLSALPLSALSLFLLSKTYPLHNLFTEYESNKV